MVGDEEDDVGDPPSPPDVSDDVAGGSDAVAAPTTASALPVHLPIEPAMGMAPRAMATRTGGAPTHPIGPILPAPMRDGDVVAIRAMSAVVDTVAPGDFEAAVGGMDALGHTTIMQ